MKKTRSSFWRILSYDGRYDVSGTGIAELVTEEEAFERLNEGIPNAARDPGSPDVMVWLVYYEGMFVKDRSPLEYEHARRMQVFYQNGDFGPSVGAPCNEDAVEPCYLTTPPAQGG